MSQDERLAREADFHNRRFAGEFERPSTEFYAITGTSDDAYYSSVGGIPAGASCLEIGCGPGSSASNLAKRGVKVTAIDISSTAIDLAREEATERGGPPIEFQVMDAEALSFDDASFDAVIGKGILHHLNLERATKSIARVLKPSGVAIFREPMGHNPIVNLYRRMTPMERTIDEHPLTRSDLKSFETAFDEVDLRFFHLTSLAAIPLRRTKHFGSLLAHLERADDRLLRRNRFMQNMSWVVNIELRRTKSAGRSDN